jgi:hypothetical protein
MSRLFYMILLLAIISCGKSNNAMPPPTPPVPPVIDPPVSPGRIINVSTAAQLISALTSAIPGDEIIMADGTYHGKFVINPNTNGTPSKPIILKGGRNAILDAGDINTGYVLYLQSNYWIMKGFTLTNGLKGLMTDGANHNIIDSLSVHDIGEEAIHLRRFSCNNIIQHVSISQTGLKTPDFGEGIYIGSANSNWATYTNGIADRCDTNFVLNNKIGPNVAAECIDIKEGTTAGTITGNNFDATGITGANSGDSWIDVKGNNYTIQNNSGYNPGGAIFKDGYQVHVAVSGWGNNNIFQDNQCVVNASGYGFNVQLSGSNGTSTGNKVYNNNTVTGAVSGKANIPLSN